MIRLASLEEVRTSLLLQEQASQFSPSSPSASSLSFMSAAGSVGASRWRGAVWDNESATVSVGLFSVVLFRSWAVGCVRFGGVVVV